MIENPVAFVESKFGIRMKRAGPGEWAGSCPWCQGKDRFRVWDRGNYQCRPGPGHCGRSGWLDELDGPQKPTELELIKWRLDRIEHEQQEQARRLSALEYMHQCGDHELYHRNLDTNERAVDYWLSEGMTPQTIHDYQLGYCKSCPTAPEHDSYTIPVIASGKLWNIRHRLCTPTDGGKYRPHRAGIPAMIFQADHLTRQTPDIVICEGEKKSIILTQATNMTNIATMGAQSFKPEWAAKLARFQRVYVCLDPDAPAKAVDVAKLFPGRGRVVSIPVKADDFFVRHGGTAAEFLTYIRNARPV
jgi:hypothetical protein